MKRERIHVNHIIIITLIIDDRYALYLCLSNSILAILLTISNVRFHIYLLQIVILVAHSSNSCEMNEMRSHPKLLVNDSHGSVI